MTAKNHSSRIFFIRMSVFILGSLVCPWTAFPQMDEMTMDSALSVLTDIKVISKTVSHYPNGLIYQLAIKQPLDHNDATKGYFYQQLRLIHRGVSLPMVMETEGYGGRTRGDELEKILHCNDLNIEFRYFNKSRPDSLQWEFCSFEQAAADLHHINQVFRSLYHSKWLSTGISRGGETSLIYKYFYTDDVDATVAYVAPMPNDIEDRRIYAFLDTAGGSASAAKIRDVQIFMLQHEKEALDRLSLAVKRMHYKTLGGLGPAYEYAILEYPFSFWQISDIDPKEIPVNNRFTDYYNHVMDVFGGELSLFSSLLSDEEGIAPYITHAYMTWQTGYYKYNLAPFRSYLHYLHGANLTAAFLPANIPRKAYDPEFEKKIIIWLREKGNNIITIYGGRDTWSACKAEFGPGLNARRFILPGANHAAARIRNMSPAQQKEFADALEEMAGLKPDFAALK